MIAIPYFRCLSCNGLLNQKASNRKYPESQKYIGLCDRCFKPIEKTIRPDLFDITEAENIEPETTVTTGLDDDEWVQS